MQLEFRAPQALFIALLWAGMTAGCASRALSEAPAKGVDLSGDWEINATLSDDAHKLLQAQFAKMRERRDRDEEPEMAPMRRPTEGMTRRGPERESTTEGSEGSEGSREERDRGMKKLARQREDRFTDMVDAPSRMQIALEGTRFVVKHDSTHDVYRAGTQSVVSFGAGVADRNVGWRGGTFVVSTKGVDGGWKEERYSLSPDGRLSLVMKLTVDRMPSIEIKRIYDRAKG